MANEFDYTYSADELTDAQNDLSVFQAKAAALSAQQSTLTATATQRAVWDAAATRLETALLDATLIAAARTKLFAGNPAIPAAVIRAYIRKKFQKTRDVAMQPYEDQYTAAVAALAQAGINI